VLSALRCSQGLSGSSGIAVLGASRGMVEARSGFFMAGLKAAFKVLEAGRDML
jgi:hypothetical protein